MTPHLAFTTPAYPQTFPHPRLHLPFKAPRTLPFRLPRHHLYLPTCSTQPSSPATSEHRTSLSGRLAVVTGGHRGVGASISLALASRGADVIVVDRSGPRDSPVPSLLAARGRHHWAVLADLSSLASLREAVVSIAQIADTRGVDILVNNAGVSLLAPLTTLTASQWDLTLATNLRAPFLLAQALATGPNGMLARGRGAIVNVSSVASAHALTDHAAYCASKAALDMLTRVMTAEWAARGVRANAVAPTVVLTEMGRRVWGPPEKGGPMLKRIPTGRFVETEEVADVVAFLASDAAAMVNGQVLAVDGGFSAI